MFADIIAKIFPSSHPAVAAAQAQPADGAPAAPASAQSKSLLAGYPGLESLGEVADRPGAAGRL